MPETLGLFSRVRIRRPTPAWRLVLDTGVVVGRFADGRLIVNLDFPAYLHRADGREERTRDLVLLPDFVEPLRQDGRNDG